MASGADGSRDGRPFAGPFLASVLLAVAFLAGCAGAEKGRTRADLMHPFLGPDYSAWLVGPISFLATPEEIDAYLALSGDEPAQEFIDRFWQKRKPNPNSSTNDALGSYEKRAVAADRLFSEGGFLGRRTDRGTVYVLYGAPVTSQFQISPAPQDPPIELWVYDADAAPGLNGKRPARFYRFIKRGAVTETYVPVTPRNRPSPVSGQRGELDE